MRNGAADPTDERRGTEKLFKPLSTCVFDLTKVSLELPDVLAC